MILHSYYYQIHMIPPSVIYNTVIVIRFNFILGTLKMISTLLVSQNSILFHLTSYTLLVLPYDLKLVFFIELKF